jgi:uncharacterized protein
VKALIVLLALLAGAWLWRNGRQKAQTRRRQLTKEHNDTPGRVVQDMVGCPVCGIHLPRSEAVSGHHGMYCSTAHRDQAEG